MPDISIINPEVMGPPLSQYGQIARVRAAELVFIAGQLATDGTGRLVGKDDFDSQMRQVLTNIGKGLQSVGGSFANVVQFTTYLVRSQDIANFRRVREQLFPALYPTHHYPPNTLLVVDRLVQEDFLIEIETIAALSSAAVPSYRRRQRWRAGAIARH
jgi:enamine deaminase RidA (YjgF/YER057c/UK114 family)